MTIDELKVKLSETTDPAEYDRVMAEIMAAEKAATLQANQERASAKAQAEAERVKKLTAFKTKLAKREKLLAQLAKDDQDLFLELGLLHSKFLERYANERSLLDLTQELNREAQELSQPTIEARLLTVCNMNIHGAPHGFDVFERVLKQFNLAASHIFDARNNNLPCPDRPGLAWFAKGDGRFWPGR